MRAASRRAAQGEQARRGGAPPTSAPSPPIAATSISTTTSATSTSRSSSTTTRRAPFADATHRDPNYALGWYNLAHALRKGDRAREAADAYRQYIRLKPDDPDPYYGLGQTLKTLGDTSGAIIAFQKYIGMEKRPEEQKWVDKARRRAAGARGDAAATASPAVQPSGKIEEKSTAATTSVRQKLDQELRRDAVLPPSDDDMRLIDPFQTGGCTI